MTVKQEKRRMENATKLFEYTPVTQTVNKKCWPNGIYLLDLARLFQVDRTTAIDPSRLTCSSQSIANLFFYQRRLFGLFKKRRA
jgi:hypothetical protein